MEVPSYLNNTPKPSIFNHNESGPKMKYVACMVVVLTILLLIALFAIYGFKNLMKIARKK